MSSNTDPPPGLRLPDGFVYWGQHVLSHFPEYNVPSEQRRLLYGDYAVLPMSCGDISVPLDWVVGLFGPYPGYHKCVREGSLLADLNGLSEQPITTYEF